MLKYVDTAVTFAEIPDEITLCINISNCPCHCEGCHSSYLVNDIGDNLSGANLEYLIKKNKGISCVSFMGGDADPSYINSLAELIRETYDNLKIAWYSGRESISGYIEMKNFDYIKVGPYIPSKGPLNNKNTNQRLYSVCRVSKLPSFFILDDITYKFWHDKDK